ncbi:MAG: HAD family phosphatase [Chloroflexi bacterium]|nr:HAD family phosphatase [Chloroflexota bacterium]
MTKLPFDAIIFDHDGTLVDTERADLESCRILYQEHGVQFSEEYWAKHIVGYLGGYDVVLDDLAGRNGHGPTREAVWNRLKELWAITSETVELMPGVADLLPQLHALGYPLAVATASDREWVKRWFTQFDLWPYFQAIATSDDVARSKPAPDVYLFAAAQLGVKPERCLVFEDSLPGLSAAKAAGMTVVVNPALHTRTLDYSLADAVIDSWEIITPEWIESFNVRRSRFKV